jgi:hypothetical protein
VVLVLLFVVGSFGAIGASGGKAPPPARPLALPRTPGSSHPASSVLHDLTALPVTLEGVQGYPASFQTSVPPGGSSAYSWSFGDGATSAPTTAPETTHTFALPGLYLVYVSATNGSGTVHDNLARLAEFPVQPTMAANPLGVEIPLAGSVLNNGSSTLAPTPIVAAGNSVTLHGEALEAPTTAGWVAQDLVFTPSSSAAPYTTVSPPSGSATSANDTIQFSASTPVGSYQIELVAAVDGPAGAVQDSNFTFTIEVSGPGAGVVTPPTLLDPHPQAITAYEDNNGSALSVDPSLDYDSFGGQVINNVYQTLIAPNGSASGPGPSDFVPVLATCVPGSDVGAGNCVSLYGSSLVSGNNYTFVINPDARFYDPSTGASWPVYPSDVVFSVTRSLAFSTAVCFACTGGWIVAQALLPYGNDSWDNDLHGIVNSTPLAEFAALSVNGSACPAVAMQSDHGCVTFDADGQGQSWPFFLELLSNPWAGEVEPAGWFSASAQGQAIPYWPAVTGSGDHPMLLPGGFNNTGPAFQTWLSSNTVPTGWDYWATTNAQDEDTLSTNDTAAGSGPYALQELSNVTGYRLVASPTYAATQGCTWSGCPPAPGSYDRWVNVSFENSNAPGEAALAGGQADLATWDPEAPGLIAAESSGRVSVNTAPMFTSYSNEFALDFNVTASTAATGVTVTAPATLFQDADLRAFLVHAMPYESVATRGDVDNGTQYGVPFAGFFPNDLGGYYPSNLTLPLVDPDLNPSDVGGAAWWWAQTKADGDAGAACTVATPCVFPIVAVNAIPAEAQADALWIGEIKNISGGAVDPVLVLQSFLAVILGVLYYGPGQDPYPVAPVGWSADYPDPSDYANALLVPDGDYSYETELSYDLSSYTAACAGSAANPTVSTSCQGTAYSRLVSDLTAAATEPSGATRALTYDLADQIATNLNVYAPLFQLTATTPYASWLDGGSLSVPPTSIAPPFASWDTIHLRTIPVVAAGAPYVTALSASPSPVPLGSQLTLTVDGSSGSGSPSYAYFGLPPGCSSQDLSPLVCTPTVNGTYPVVASVTASDGQAIQSGGWVTVGGTHVAISEFTASPAIFGIGGTTYLNLTTVGGSLPLTYQYSGLPPGCVASDAASLVCTPARPGSYTVEAHVSDAQGDSAYANASFDAQGLTITIGFFGASPVSIPLGGTSYLNVSASGGSGGGFTYSFAGLPAGCASADTDSLACTPTVAGEFNVSVDVSDSLGDSASAVASLTVVAAYTGPVTVIASFGATSPGVATGATTTFVTVATAGSGVPLTYAYTGLPTGCSSRNASSLPCTPTTAGTYSVKVSVHSPEGAPASATASVLVVAAPPAGSPVSSVSVSPSSADLAPGAVQALSALAVNATGTPVAGAVYTWSMAPGGVGTLNHTTGEEIGFTATASGNVTVWVNATAGGATHGAQAALTVGSAGGSGVPSIELFLASGNGSPYSNALVSPLGSDLTFEVVAYDAGSYSYVGLPTGCVAPADATSFSCVPTALGSFTPTVNAISKTNARTSTTLSVSIVAPPVGNGPPTGITSSSSSLPAWVLYAGIAAAIIVVVAVLVLVLRSRRPPASPPAEMEPSVEDETGPVEESGPPT